MSQKLGGDICGIYSRTNININKSRLADFLGIRSQATETCFEKSTTGLLRFRMRYEKAGLSSSSAQGVSNNY